MNRRLTRSTIRVLLALAGVGGMVNLGWADTSSRAQSTVTAEPMYDGSKEMEIHISGKAAEQLFNHLPVPESPGYYKYEGNLVVGRIGEGIECFDNRPFECLLYVNEDGRVTTPQ